MDHADNADGAIADADAGTGAAAGTNAAADAAGTFAAAAGDATPRSGDDAAVDARAAPAVSPPPDRSHEYNEREDRWAGVGVVLP